MFAALILLLLPNISQAASIGTILKNDHEFVKRGETGSFVVLLWNMEESTPVKMSVRHAPKDWNIIIDPREFVLNQSKEKGPPYDPDAQYVNSNGVIITSIPVRILVNVPKNSDLGEHVIIVTAIIGEPQDGMSFLLEKNFRLVVNVVSPFGNSMTKNATSGGENVFTGLTSLFAGTNLVILSISIMATVIIISWVVYRRV
jgi:hypothetical protein